MPQDNKPAPNSGATTRKTEPSVVAAIVSAEGRSDPRVSSRHGSLAFLIGAPILLLAAATAIGYGATRWLRRRT